jgi:AcrR family transcriptional regulator
MTTESKFKVALKALMTEKSIDDISVTILCKKCGCHRQTFYYHYTDIYDLIADILLNENLGDFEKATTVQKALASSLNTLRKISPSIEPPIFLPRMTFLMNSSSANSVPNS